MSWQEELRKLDEELASGKLSADDYRVRRDQVLSSAVGQPDAPQPGSENSGSDATQVIPPISPPQGVPQQQQPASDPDRTQAVSPWQPQQPQQPGTQYVPPQYPASPPGGFPQAGPMPPAGGFPQAGPMSPPGGFPQAGPMSPPGGFPQAGGFQPGWNTAEADQAPPWGGGDLPPLSASSGDASWVQQGPESSPSKGNGTKIAAIVGAVVVLVGVAIGAYLLWGPSATAHHDQPSAQPSTSQTNTQKPDPLAVANLPGAAESHDNVTTFNAVPGLNYLNSDELSTYSDAGAGPVKYVVHHLDDGNTVVLLLAQVNSPVAAQNAANELLNIQVHNGAHNYGDVPKGVYASAIDAKDGAQAQVRAHYTHGNVIVRIEVQSASLQSAQTDFAEILSAQMKVLPADG